MKYLIYTTLLMLFSFNSYALENEDCHFVDGLGQTVEEIKVSCKDKIAEYNYENEDGFTEYVHVNLLTGRQLDFIPFNSPEIKGTPTNTWSFQSPAHCNENNFEATGENILFNSSFDRVVRNGKGGFTGAVDYPEGIPSKAFFLPNQDFRRNMWKDPETRFMEIKVTEEIQFDDEVNGFCLKLNEINIVTYYDLRGAKKHFLFEVVDDITVSKKKPYKELELKFANKYYGDYRVENEFVDGGFEYEYQYVEEWEDTTGWFFANFKSAFVQDEKLYFVGAATMGAPVNEFNNNYVERTFSMDDPVSKITIDVASTQNLEANDGLYVDIRRNDEDFERVLTFRGIYTGELSASFEEINSSFTVRIGAEKLFGRGEEISIERFIIH